MYFIYFLIIILIISIIIWLFTSKEKEKEKETHVHPKPVHDQKSGKVKIRGSPHHLSYDLVLKTFEGDEVLDTVKTDGSTGVVTFNTGLNEVVESSNLSIVGNSTPEIYAVALTNTTDRKFTLRNLAGPLPPSGRALATSSFVSTFSYNSGDTLKFDNLSDCSNPGSSEDFPCSVTLRVVLDNITELSHSFTLVTGDLEGTTFVINNANFVTNPASNVPGSGTFQVINSSNSNSFTFDMDIMTS